MDIITARDVRFLYENGETGESNERDAQAGPAGRENAPAQPVMVLDGVDLAIRQGEFIALLGHNGSGKSTLAKHFNAMLLPAGGTVLVREMNTADEEKKYEIRRTVGMVLQNPDNQLVSTIVEEDVAFGPENLGIEPAEIRRRVDDALKTVGMYDYRAHAPHKLSGGQKQRVAIAGILAMQPDCLVLDEPTAMLDPKGRREVLDTVSRLNKERGMTVVLITHYMEEAARADRVVVMDDGKIRMQGTPREVFSQVEALRAIELDVPQPTELCWELRRRGVPLPDGVLTAEECAEALALLFGRSEKEVPAAPAAEPAGRRNPAIQSAEPPVIETKDLTYTYSPGTPFQMDAMTGVSLSVRKGDFVGIIGHTGSGKSTLVQHLNGLLRPTAGQVLLNGRDIWAEPKKIREIRFRVGLVFQYPEHQLFEETARKDIAFGPKNMGLPEEEIERRVLRAAEFVGLKTELLEKSPFELSGGEKRRVAIAGVMAMQPEVLILDEPTAGLDPRGRDMILEQIRAYQQETGATVLLVSHSMEDIARVAKRVLVMNGGRIAMFDDTPAVFSRAKELEAIGLSIPAVTRVFMLLREKGYPVGDNVYTVEQAAGRLLPLLENIPQGKAPLEKSPLGKEGNAHA